MCFVVIQNSERWTKSRHPVVLKHRRVDDFKMYFREIGWGGIDWIDLAQDRDQWRALVNAVINCRVQLNAGNFMSGCTTGGLPRRVSKLRGVN
jgi:hypothetical protein